MRFIFFAILLGLCGCATPYQEMGFMGGVEAQQMTADTYRIVARGNGFTGSHAVQDFTILKAAETAKKAGATHFAIISASDASRTGAVVVPGQAQTSFTGNVAYTTYTPSTVHQYVKPGQDTYIRVFTVAVGQKPGPGMLSADEIIQFVGGRIKKPT
jgi:hypothetical protein